MLAHAAPQGARVDVQEGGSTIFAVQLPVGLFERQQDMIAFNLFEGLDRIADGRRGDRRCYQWCSIQLQTAALSIYDGPLDHIFQLPDIARPGMFAQLTYGGRRYRLYTFAEFSTDFTGHVFGQLPDVVSSFS